MESNNLLEDFKKAYKISRAIYWNEKSGQFCARAYSATITTIKVNEAFDKFKAERLTA